jgi:hypothetical protein
MSNARLRVALDGILAAWDDTLEPARRATESHAVTRLANPPLPVPANVLDKRATAHEHLAYWSRMVINSQHLHLLPAIDVPTLCAFLTIHVDTLVAWPKALTELEKSARDLGAIAADSVPRRQVVGPCTGSTTNGQPCPGTITATIRRDEDLLPSELRCDATPRHAFPAGEWRAMERRLHMNESAARRLAAAINSAP